MLTDLRTTNFNWPKPHPDNNARMIDVGRIGDTFDGVDAQVATVRDLAAAVAALQSGHRAQAAALASHASAYIRTAGFLAPGDGGDALYEIVEADPAEAGSAPIPGLGKFLRLARGADNLRAFGVLPDVADNGPPLVAALASTVSRRKHLRTGTYPVASPIVTTVARSFEGDGRAASTLSFSGLAAGQDAFTVALASASYAQSRGHAYRGFGIVPTVAGAGRFGMRVTLAASMFMAGFVIEDINIGEFGDAGLYLDNTADNLDGFFTAIVRDALIYNGVRGRNVGDSLNFERLVVTAGSLGQNPAIDLEGVPGARQYIVRECNLTCRAEQLKAVACDQLRHENNQNEHSWWNGEGSHTGTTGAMLYVADSHLPIIRGNTANPFPNFAKPVAAVAGLWTNGSDTITGLTSVQTAPVQVGDKISSTDGMIPTTYTVTAKTATTITFDGVAVSTALANVTIARVVNTNPPAANLAIDGTTDGALVEENDLAKGGVAHISIAATVRNTRIGPNRYYGQVPVILDAGLGTMGILKPVTGFANGWAAVAGKVPTYFKDAYSFEVLLAGEVSGGVVGQPIAVLPIGMRPAVTFEVGVITWDGSADQLGRLRVQADGQIILVRGANGNVSLAGIKFQAPLVA